MRNVEGGATRSARGESATVLVVDDFEDTRSLFRCFLETNGYRVLEASNGREAIEVAAADAPALILMDLNMPVLDGFTATLRLRENEATLLTPVVAMTAYDTAESRAAARAVGCTDYLIKPVDFNQLLLLVRSLTHLERARAGGEATG